MKSIIALTLLITIASTGFSQIKQPIETDSARIANIELRLEEYRRTNITGMLLQIAGSAIAMAAATMDTQSFNGNNPLLVIGAGAATAGTIIRLTSYGKLKKRKPRPIGA